MRVALIFPPYGHKVFSENLSTVDEEFCLAPPIILAYVAAILEKHGHKVIIVDARALHMSKEETLRRIKNFAPDILGFRAETYHFHDALEWVAFLKRNLSIPVVAGGINLSLYPKETLSHGEIDYGIIGEATQSLPGLLSALENGSDISGISGIVYKKDGDITVNPAVEQDIDFDNYPFPSRHLLPNEAYYSFISQLRNFTIMLASTGCPFRCTFCAIHPNTKYRARSAKSVIDEIEVCYKEFNIREIDFFDAVFFLDKKRLSGIFNGIKTRRLKIEWSCRSRVDVVDEEILRQAAGAGCRQIYYGIESADPKILETIRKGVKVEQVRQAIKWSKKYGIRPMGFFMVGNPHDTEESVRRTIEFSKNLGLDFIQVCRTIAKPGTDLDKILIEKTGKDYWRDHIVGKEITGRLPTPWSVLSEQQVEALTKEFYLKFYFRPRILWNRMLQLKSFQEFKRYVKVGWKMLLQKSELCAHLLTDTAEAEKVLIESNKYLPEARAARVAIVVPTYNEKDNIVRIAPMIHNILPNAHIVIVDDNSMDGTRAIAQELSNKNDNIHVVHRKEKKGLGFAYKDGFKFVLSNLDSDYIFEMDADLSHNPDYLPIFLHYAKDYDLVTGSRFLRRVSIKNRALWRNFISKSTKWVVNIITDLQLSDVTTGYKCFRRETLKRMDFNTVLSRGYAFQIEVSYNINRMGGTIKEVPVLFTERIYGKSKMSLRIFLEGIYLVLKLSLRCLDKDRKTFI